MLELDALARLHATALKLLLPGAADFGDSQSFGVQSRDLQEFRSSHIRCPDIPTFAVRTSWYPKAGLVVRALPEKFRPRGHGSVRHLRTIAKQMFTMEGGGSI